jgi:hypothetical protein
MLHNELAQALRHTVTMVTPQLVLRVQTQYACDQVLTQTLARTREDTLVCSSTDRQHY